MKISTRRGAILLCTLALNVFFLLSPIGSVTLGARRCQQECDGEFAACKTTCNQSYTEGSNEWQACQAACNHDYYFVCSPTAITCGSNPCETHCYNCGLTCTSQDPDTGECTEFADECWDTGYTGTYCACW